MAREQRKLAAILAADVVDYSRLMERAAGGKLFFLPKYSPDLNPIEKFFAKLKHWLRKAARRTVDAVYNAVAEILPLTSPAECSNYFAQAGYAQPKTITL